MNPNIKPIPNGFHTVTPYILVDDVSRALEFYKRAFGAEVLYCLEVQPGVITHAEFKIGNSIMMISGSTPTTRAPHNVEENRSVSFRVYVNDIDLVAKQVVGAGMKVIREVADQIYGDRSGTFEDPFGHIWSIGTHVEDVSKEEITKRMKKLYGGGRK